MICLSGQHSRLREHQASPLVKEVEIVLPEIPTTITNCTPRAPSAGLEQDPTVSTILEVRPTGTLKG